MMALGQSLYQVVNGVDPLAPLPAQQTPSQKLGRGQLIAGVLADMLAGAMGRAGPFAQNLAQQRDQQQEMANWGLKRRADLQDYATKLQIEGMLKPDVSPMERDAQAWAQMTQPERDAYMQMSDARSGPVTVTLPNGQFYSGPRSGLAAALQGYQTTAPAKPVGKLTPVDGGPTPSASGGFRY